MRDAGSEELWVQGFLERRGFGVERIPAEHTAKRADLKATAESETYLIEVKCVTAVPPCSEENGILQWSVDLGHSNTVSKVIKDGARQLASTPGSEQPLRLVWFIATTIDGDAHLQQIEATLYGVVGLVYDIDAGRAECKPCYFFDFSEFYRRPELDGAVVGTFERGCLCLNPCSENASALRRSRLWQTFAQDGAVRDPETAERDGRAFVADFAGDRRDERAMLDGVKKKYGLEFLVAFRPVQRNAAAVLLDG
jgi:hypothetical protein